MGLSPREGCGTGFVVRWLALGPGVLTFILCCPAFAQTSAEKQAAAEALFNEGRRLATAGQFAEACPKFEASQKLDPGLGTLLNLADCYEQTGKTASAWAQYREAIPLARAAGSTEREEIAVTRSKALESRLSTLTIRAMSGDAGGPALDVRRDGISLDSAQLSTPIPVDPGPHEVTASAPGKRTWTTTVEVGAAAKVVVEVPKLEEGDGSSGTPADGGDSGTKRSAQAPIGLAVGAAGIVGLGIGTFFALSASSTWKDAKSGCNDYPYECTSQALDDRESASSKATVSTIAFIAGGAALAVGTVLWLTAGSGPKQTALGIGPGSVTARGTF